MNIESIAELETLEGWKIKADKIDGYRFVQEKEENKSGIYAQIMYGGRTYALDKAGATGLQIHLELRRTMRDHEAECRLLGQDSEAPQPQKAHSYRNN